MKILIWRTGAYGDVLITTPLVRYLHSQGHQIFYVAGERGEEVLKNNPNITKIVEHDKNVKNELLGEHIEWLRKKNHCDRVIDLNESIECALSQHPRSPNYKLTKPERIAKFNRNFYEYTFEHAKELWDKDINFKPELFFDDSEIKQARSYIKPDSYNVLIGLSGSGNNKAYPWMMDLCANIMSNYPNVHIITVGDLKCQILEDVDVLQSGNITKLSGQIPMRISMALTSMVNLVISPDTGLLHASGCYDTPKMGLLGHNTIECITKYFSNDYSIESDPKLAQCSPCLYMVYDIKQQCPLNPITQGSICMSDGIPLQKVYDKFKEIYDRYRENN